MVEVQQTYLVLQQVALRVVREYRARSGPLSPHIGDLLPMSNPMYSSNRYLVCPPRAVREVGDGMRLVEDLASVLSVRRNMVSDDAVNLELPSHLEDLVEDVIQRLSNLLIGDDVDVVEDAHRLLEILDLYRVRAGSRLA